MGECVVIPIRRSRGSEAHMGDFLPVELAGGGAQGHAESSPASFSTEGLDLLLLQATHTAARSKRLAKRARQFLSECQSVSCGGVLPGLPR